jgi:hypothetical protein
MRLKRKLVVTAIAVLPSVACFAALGGDVTTVQADQAHMRAQRQITQSARYSVHAMTAETGTNVREFVSPDGKVFGVAWDGPAHPDLEQLLGSYYEEFRQSLPTHRVHHPLTIRTGNIVVQSGGHMRALFGRAYIPGMVPQDVQIEEIK